jgi:hypothetical protein
MKDSLIKAKKIDIAKPYFYKSPQRPKPYIQDASPDCFMDGCPLQLARSARVG